jgi:hypothetical protein
LPPNAPPIPTPCGRRAAEADAADRPHQASSAWAIRTLDPEQAEKAARPAQSHQRNGPRFLKGLKKIG